ncbi:MAG: amidohydrolase [Bacteroidetes bacterium]|nr:amidohydrolase [Bacteroidota bacterium]
MQDLKITIIQSNLHWENIEANLKMFSEKISSIKEETDLVVLPEMFSTGFTMNNKFLAEKMNGKTLNWMKQMAKEKNCVVTGSVIIEEKKKYYNRLIWMPPSGKYKTYDKRHLFRYAGEEKYYSAGKKKLIVELNGWKICPMVCYDLRFPVWIRNKIKKDPSTSLGMTAEYDLLLFVANWPERRNHPWKTLLMARAMENQSYVIGINRVGNDGNNIYHSGDSAVINFKGEIISKTPAHEESIETITISKKDLDDWRKNFPAWMDADKFKLL